MEIKQEHSKRPRLNSWTSSHQLIDSSSFPFPQHNGYSPQSQYSNSSTMAGWGESKSRSQSMSGGGSTGGSSTSKPGHQFSYATFDHGDSHPSASHPISVDSHGISPMSSDVQGFNGFSVSQSQGASDIETRTSTATSSPLSQVMARQQLRPLQTQPGVFHDSATFFHQAPPGTSTDHRGSMSAEMGSPASSGAVGPGGYPGVQGHQLIGASPIVPLPITTQGGMILGGAQGMNVVTTYPPRRKAIRAAQACDACRARKAKCDEGRPSCGFCKESQVACVYREVPPPKQDRTLLQILDRLGRVESLLETMNSHGAVSPQQSSTASPPIPPRPSTAKSQAPVPTQKPTLSEEDEQLTIPYQHTTAAHKLLWWPSIRKLIDAELLKHDTYVIDEEQSRGILRIYGRGEEPSGGDPNFEEEGEYIGSSTENWGGMFHGAGDEWENESRGMNGSSRDERVMDDHSVLDHQRGAMPGFSGLGLDGKLRLDRQTVQELLNSYFTNIHILHPILDKANITHTVFRFAELFGSGPQETSSGSRSGLGNDGVEAAARHRNNSSGKRKRSGSIPHPDSYPEPTRARRIPRTVHSALVLLVLALGAVCLHRRPVPGPLPRTQFPSVFRDSNSPYGGSETSFHQQQQQQFGGEGGKELRNVDVIPGLGYFVQAMDIIGALVGSNELENVQAGLLAGLYWGQLGRVLDGWKWISWACMGCQILIRMKLASEKDSLRKDLIVRAFWSCLQLESDVLAELDLPPSGISRLEDSMVLPSGITSPPSPHTEIARDDPLMWMYYLAHIALRKLLNRVHTALYKQDKTHLDSPRSLAIARELDYQLEAWKSTLPGPLRWDSSDPPSQDINAARLRAKYFGARYIIHRPFVYYALHGGMAHYRRPGSPAGDEQSGEDRGDITPTELEINCRKCIDSARQSTTAFHAFDPDEMRPIITNVFETAHAQFGNLLMLQAAYQSPTLRGMIPSHVLGDLLNRTIRWFNTLTSISPALRRDATILRNAAEGLGFQLPAPSASNQSYFRC